jgi:hypothetical protein
LELGALENPGAGAPMPQGQRGLIFIIGEDKIDPRKQVLPLVIDRLLDCGRGLELQISQQVQKASSTLISSRGYLSCVGGSVGLREIRVLI